MGVCTFFDKSMKVLSSILAMATAQWDGFNYDDYSDVGKNQISQVSVQDIAQLNGLGSGTQLNNYNLPNHYLGNGLKCFFCNERSVGECFSRSTFSVCQGQEYFCFFHERRKISHFFNRREKYIDHFASDKNDVYLARSANEAFNLKPSGNVAYPVTTDVVEPQTLVHIMAGCQQPQACLRQQSQNNPITIGIQFYGSGTDTIKQDSLPTSRRNVREGLCRLGKDWTYYSGHHWYYDDNTDFVYSRSGSTITTPDGRTVPNGGWYNDATTLTGSVRADNEVLTYNNSPLRNSWDLANAGWISRQRYHGMYRNPETQVAQNWVSP